MNDCAGAPGRPRPLPGRSPARPALAPPWPPPVVQLMRQKGTPVCSQFGDCDPEVQLS